MVDRQTVELGFLLRQFKDYEFSMANLDNRIQLQKFIYMLQVHNIYLGYDYSWYVRGPYCTTLARRGFTLERIYDEVPKNEVRFADRRIQDRFARFKKFISGKVNNVKYLEAVASLHMLKISDMDDEKAITKVVSKKPDRFDRDYCRKILDEDVKPLLTAGMLQIPTFDKNQITLNAFPSNDDLANSFDMDYKPIDKTFYYMLKDAGDTDIILVGKNLFRRNERRPKPDMLSVDKAASIHLLTSGQVG